MNNLDLVLKAFATELSSDKLPSGMYNKVHVYIMKVLYM